MQLPTETEPAAAPRRAPSSRWDDRLPVRAQPAGIGAGMPARVAFRAIVTAGLTHLRGNVPAGRGRLAFEFLHQIRVALRRLRSGVEIFAPLLGAAEVGRLERGFKSLGKKLGPARNWDVLITEILPQFARERGEFSRINAALQKPHSVAALRARRTVDSTQLRRLQRDLEQLASRENRPARLNDLAARAILDAPVEDFAYSLLEHRYKQLRKRGRGIGGQSSRDLHRLRIAVKRLRYATEFFGDLFDRRAAHDFRARLVRLQDILGAMNDAVTSSELIARERDAFRKAHASGARESLLAWLDRRPTMLKRELKRAWKEFRATPRFW